MTCLLLAVESVCAHHLLVIMTALPPFFCGFFFVSFSLFQVEGLFFDEVSKIRVLDTTKAAETVELRDECKQFVDRIGQFQGTVGGLIDLVTNLSKAVEAQKLNVSQINIYDGFMPCCWLS